MIANVVTEISVDLYGETQFYEVSAKQYDKQTRQISVALLNNGAEYKIPTDALLMVNVRKPDGKYVYNACELKDNHVLVSMTNQMLSAAGTATADVEIRSKDGSQILSSASFTIEIEPSMRNETAIESSNEFSALDEELRKLDESENIRVKNEDKRKKNELERIETETARKQAETVRQEQEESREYRTSKAIENADQATTRATAATAEAIQIVSKAEAALSSEEELQRTANEVRIIRDDVQKNSDVAVRAADEAKESEQSISDMVGQAIVGVTKEMIDEVKRYYEMASQLNNSITVNIDCGNPFAVDHLDCDGGTPFTKESIVIDCGTPFTY